MYHHNYDDDDESVGGTHDNVDGKDINPFSEGDQSFDTHSSVSPRPQVSEVDSETEIKKYFMIQRNIHDKFDPVFMFAYLNCHGGRGLYYVPLSLKSVWLNELDHNII